MDSQETLHEYSQSIRRLRKQCYEAGMNDEEFRKMYFESLDSISSATSPSVTPNTRRITRKHQVLLAVVCILCVIYNFKVIYSCLVCNLQDYVYPGLRLLRRLSIPFISLFPSLTDWYHESCLIQNPFFTVVDMDCWPCSTVSNIREIYDPKPVNQQHSAPFVYETDQQEINLVALKDLYEKHKDIFNKESSKILVNNKISIHPQELFQRIEFKNDNSFYSWRFNNMNLARVLRQVISRPKVVPKFGQSTERFLIIDSSQESFPVPDTELWYNWWYWRPVIAPSNGNATFIAHVGSYC
ncbi:hypothetical protein NE865_02696 [Phthorimaea operculella]|nr:hypothetical protein NE865_02696 [Phthorimaea operculella]